MGSNILDYCAFHQYERDYHYNQLQITCKILFYFEFNWALYKVAFGIAESDHINVFVFFVVAICIDDIIVGAFAEPF